MGAKESVEATAKLNTEDCGHVERGSRYHSHRHNQRSQSLNRGQTLSQADVSGIWWQRGASGKAGQGTCANCLLGNKLSCSCVPLMRKAYRYEESSWQTSRRRDGHLLSSYRLWAEVFHVSASGAGNVKWQQVSEDLVPVNITCTQDSPECVFHITAYNSQVDKILDVRLVQPGTRIGQASECFVYWKDPMTNDTWGLNFTSPIDAKQFRDCCSPFFKFSRKASSSYSLKLDPPSKGKIKTKRKPVSTPASPSRVRNEPHCTCMFAEKYEHMKTDPRVQGSSTFPRSLGPRGLTENNAHPKVTNANSITSLYDNISGSMGSQTISTAADSEWLVRQVKQQQQSIKESVNVGVNTGSAGVLVGGIATGTLDSGTHDINESKLGPEEALPSAVDGMNVIQNESTQVGDNALMLQNLVTTGTKSIGTRTKDYSDDMIGDIHAHDLHQYQQNITKKNTRRKTKSTEEMNVDTSTLKPMLNSMPSIESPVTSPEMGRRRYNYYNTNAFKKNTAHHIHPHTNLIGENLPPAAAMGMGMGRFGAGFRQSNSVMYHKINNNNKMGRPIRHTSRFSGSRSAHDIGHGYSPQRNLYLELERERGMLKGSPSSDNVMFDNQCYATTPSSSNGNSDKDQSYAIQQQEQLKHIQMQSQKQRGYVPERFLHHQAPNVTPAPGSPTSRLLLEYEMHLRNTLAKGMDAESYSLHTFEALLSQSMENLAIYSKSSTLPFPSQRPLSTVRDKENGRDRDGYYSDRNELIRERERDRDGGYLSDHNANFSNSRCASCIEESTRAQWFGSSDDLRFGSSTGSGQDLSAQQSSIFGHKRSTCNSLPSLRPDNSLNDCGYKRVQADPSGKREEFNQKDSLRSDYLIDRESRYSIVEQASIESTDSRMCFLTSSEISDDDRMSLTTAVSDDDESVMASPYKTKATVNAASSFNCTGAVRKAGFLLVKKWLLRKKHQIELARKRGWKGYWVCLKGTTLLFYPCDSREGRTVEATPKHLIIVDGAIMQPIPEHPKREYIFCLSTAFGDAYLFQAPCQVELDNWVNSIHSACAAAFARHRGKTGTLHMLQEEIFRLEKAIESDHKLRHMAELQQSVVSDQYTRDQIQTQILQWDESLERIHCEQFRLRCYMASLQSGELPNPKSLLTNVSRPTKNTLNKLGVFTASSFHAFICARSPSLLNNLLAGRGAIKRRLPLLSRSNSASSRRSMQMNSRDETEKSLKVSMPDNLYSTVYLRDTMSVEEFLAAACIQNNLTPMDHFVRVKKRRDMEDNNYFVPHRNDLIENYLHNHEFVEVCVKILYQVELQRTALEHMWGFSVEAELIENVDGQDELCCYVSRVEDKSVAMNNGIIKGDEILIINNAIVSDLDMMYLESVLQEEQKLCMMMRSSRTEPPELVGIMQVTDDMIDSLVCPPPPTDPPFMSEEIISGLIVPAPGWNGNGKDMLSSEAEASLTQSNAQSDGPAGLTTDATETKPNSRTHSCEINNLLKTAEQVTGFCRSPEETRKSSPTGSVSSFASNVFTPSRQRADAEKLRKVILELVETERTYVTHLNNLLEHYLEPMKFETFLSNAEINALFGNIREIVEFQRQFLQNLEEALALDPDFHKFEHCSQFRNVLFAIGSAFLYYVNHFKLYSSFCASHSKAQKVLHPNEDNHALQDFLASRNPKQQHSSSLESYLIKPIQRILKYPLLLQQMCNLTVVCAEEHVHLCEALNGMEKVAEHINEMQRIHEEYGAIFDHLFRQHQKSCKQPIALSPGDLLYYGGVEWLNISDFLGKIKKGLELHAMCFVFKAAVVFLCKERLRQKKKLVVVSNKNTPNEVEIIRYQVLIPVTEVQVRASSAKDMDSHFLWELIHLRSQLQRRSEKVYVLSNSTADFRNAFLKSIRQTIRESVKNMYIPMKGFGSPMFEAERSNKEEEGPCVVSGGIFHTLERPKQQIKSMQASQTLGKTKKKTGSQHHSVENIVYDKRSASQDAVAIQDKPSRPQLLPSTFRRRSKTVGDVSELTTPIPECSPGDKLTTEQPHQLRLAHKQRMQDDDLIQRIYSGTKSEGEDDYEHGNVIMDARTCAQSKPTLGGIPNHLTLSTTSTLSVGSTGSQAKLIKSSHPPANYQPMAMNNLGSPVWKLRDMINFSIDAQST